MSKQTVIKVENLSKQYQLGNIGTGTISKDLNRTWARILGKPDPYLKIGETNDRTKKGESNLVWALKDINFEVQQGDVLGIIGKNGAGKSTLLKILSKVTGPTIGSIKAKGRIASLLEVGTGFHPELTGRENIFLNGAILGMTKIEIRSKLDEIVDFSGIERYLDTPVKRYSSGMMVRLGFAVAAHLEPEILVVDEVLAVGDAEFQKKAIGKMQDVSTNHGRTVLFVSHNMGSIKSLCNKGIVLKNGEVQFNGDINNAIEQYQKVFTLNDSSTKKWSMENAPGNNKIKMLSIEVLPANGNILNISSGVKIKYSFYNFTENVSLGTTIEILNKDGVLILHNGSYVAKNNSSKSSICNAEITIPEFLLNTNHYSVNVAFGHNRQQVYIYENILQFYIENDEVNGVSLKLPGVLRTNLELKNIF